MQQLLLVLLTRLDLFYPKLTIDSMVFLKMIYFCMEFLIYKTNDVHFVIGQKLD